MHSQHQVQVSGQLLALSTLPPKNLSKFPQDTSLCGLQNNYLPFCRRGKHLSNTVSRTTIPASSSPKHYRKFVTQWPEIVLKTFNSSKIHPFGEETISEIMYICLRVPQCVPLLPKKLHLLLHLSYQASERIVIITVTRDTVLVHTHVQSGPSATLSYNYFYKICGEEILSYYTL